MNKIVKQKYSVFGNTFWHFWFLKFSDFLKTFEIFEICLWKFLEISMEMLKTFNKHGNEMSMFASRAEPRLDLKTSKQAESKDLELIAMFSFQHCLIENLDNTTIRCAFNYNSCAFFRRSQSALLPLPTIHWTNNSVPCCRLTSLPFRSNARLLRFLRSWNRIVFLTA